MSHNLTITDHARLLDPNETMEIYFMHWQTKMQSIGEWATDVELSAAASMLSTTIYTFSPNGGTYQWLRHAPFENVGEIRESVYLTNIGNHFEPVRRKHSPCNFVFIHTCIYLFIFIFKTIRF